MVRVKICGITSIEDARLSAEAGADALGFIFVEGTPRFIAPEVAARIIAELPPFVTPVAEACGLRALQFHGDEPPEVVAGSDLPTIKTIKVSGPESLELMDRYRVSAFLLDSPARWSEGEPRAPIPWELVRRAAARRPVILSAGLTPDNVSAAIQFARPFAVDVNSGVEAQPGRKDPAKVRRFVAAAKAVDLERS